MEATHIMYNPRSGKLGTLNKDDDDDDQAHMQEGCIGCMCPSPTHLIKRSAQLDQI